MTLDERDLNFTARSHDLLNQISRWSATSVFSKAVWLGLGYFLLQVGVSKVTTLFLAWLNLQMEWMSVTGISFAVFFLGQALFLVPLMPGLPVYITCGVVIGAAGLREGWSFGGSMVWATAVGWACKQVSCLMQYFLIGKLLQNQVWVKSILCVNSPTIKAMRVIMEKPGVMSLDKISLMVGGPDWPTHVLAGVIGVSPGRLQLGTIPIVFPIGLTVIAGGGLLKVEEGGTWVALSAMFLMLAATALGCCTLAAVLALERTVVKEPDEIKKIPDDPQTKMHDDDLARKKEKVADREQWGNLKVSGKATLLLTIFFMFCSTALTSLSSDECFAVVQLTTDYRLPPLNGNVVNLIKNPLGWIAIAFQGAALLLFAIFKLFLVSSASNIPITNLQTPKADAPQHPVQPASFAFDRQTTVSKPAPHPAATNGAQPAVHPNFPNGAYAVTLPGFHNPYMASPSLPHAQLPHPMPVQYGYTGTMTA